MPYKIYDNDRPGHYFADGAEFATPEECKAQLVSHHWEEVKDMTIDETTRATPEEFAQMFNWEIEECDEVAGMSYEI